MEYNYSMNAMRKVANGISMSNMALVGGNGGSAEQSSHFVAELTGSFEGNLSTYPAISMCANTAEITAFANDFGYDNLFVRYYDAFEKFDPYVLLLSTSGTSKNVVKLANYMISKDRASKLALLVGREDKFNLIDYGVTVVKVEYDDTATIQEAHMHILHNIASLVKSRQ
jgi:phosphoheptose isomerase